MHADVQDRHCASSPHHHRTSNDILMSISLRTFFFIIFHWWRKCGCVWVCVCVGAALKSVKIANASTVERVWLCISRIHVCLKRKVNESCDAAYNTCTSLEATAYHSVLSHKQKKTPIKRRHIDGARICWTYKYKCPGGLHKEGVGGGWYERQRRRRMRGCDAVSGTRAQCWRQYRQGKARWQKHTQWVSASKSEGVSPIPTHSRACAWLKPN